MTCTFTPAQLDKQSKIKIDAWLDVGSEAHKDRDDNLKLTKEWLKIGLEGGFLFCDSLGRVWGSGAHFGSPHTVYYPYHIEYGKKLYGIRVATKAAN